MLGEAAAGALDRGPRALDAALSGWERRRERECLEAYVWTNALGRAAAMTAIEQELYRSAARDPELARRVLDVFSRVRAPSEAVPMRLGLVLAARALRRPGADRAAVLRASASELRAALGMRVQRLGAASRAAAGAGRSAAGLQ
jgi:hypothetical protein